MKNVFQVGCIFSEVSDVDLENLRAVFRKARRIDVQVVTSPLFNFSHQKNAWLSGWDLLNALTSGYAKGNFKMNWKRSNG